MKKFLLVIVANFLLIQLHAQDAKENQIALNLYQSNVSAIGLSPNETDQYTVSSTYVTANGIRMVYMNQTYLNIPVHNKMLVLAFKNNVLISNAGKGVDQLAQKLNLPAGQPGITVEQSVDAVLKDLKITSTNPIKIRDIDAKGYHFGDLGVSAVDIVAHLVWLPMNDKEVRLTWQVEIAPLKTSDHLLMRVDAVTGKVIDRNNYTVYENFHQHEIAASSPVQVTSSINNQVSSPTLVNAASYRVIPYPAESPMHPGGTAALVTDPWNLAPGNATSLKWHYDGTAYHDSTRGNNVWAQEDRDNNNNTFGRAGLSSTAQPTLTFDITPDFTVAPTTTNFQRFATTNLFYWNNIIHDLTYQYGFDEVSGNFQNNNQSRGGLGADYVIADAQDGGGTNNANFSTPADGSRPRMQMYLGTNVTPNRDGDLDNGVIVHEYGHGISNRLTGGPANSSCLSNAEQAGEGWSDYYALMTTTNWATATVNDGGLTRPIGNYLFGQTISGGGIRTYPYSTNMTINQNTYAMVASAGTSVHRIGEIWCSALWDMTWEIIAMDGINTNLFNASGIGGNSVALKLVTEGLRLQPCSPGFLDSRNAILKADSILYNGKYKCAIWKAFARRGMGKNAVQGSSGSTTDQVADFTDNGGYTYKLTQSVTQQQEGLNVTYNHILNAGNCGNLLNHVIRDTLPSNVTYVSGGTYTAASRVVSFPVNINAGDIQTYSYTVTINSGSYYPLVNLLNDSVPAAAISSTWTPSSTTSTVWTTSTAQKTSAPYSMFTADIASVSDQKLETTNAINLPANPPLLSFQGYINAETNYDGGVIEISNNNGSSWTDLGSAIVSGGYNGTLSNAYANPIGGRAAFTGNSGAFFNTLINLSAYAGQNVKLRFRFGSDNAVAGTGWYIDDITMIDQAKVNIRSRLFNANNITVAASDTFTLILSGTTCNVGVINTQPSSLSVCASQNTGLLNLVATGSGLTYQWQLSVNGGSSFSNITGATDDTLNLTGISASMNGYQYRCVINGTCTANLISNAAQLNVNALPIAPSGLNASRCGTGTVTLTATAGVGETIDWYNLPSGGNALLTGNGNYTTPVLFTTTSYYAQARNLNTGCISASRTTFIAIINSSSNSTSNASVCSNQLPYVWNGINYNTSGTYTKTLTNAVGCDSIATLNLTVKSTSNSTSNASVCSNQLPYVWNGTNYNASGTYTKILTNAVGCDSIATLNLTVKSTSNSTTSASVCSNQLPYVWNGINYNTSGTYTKTLTNAVGCDSIATLNLTVKSTSNSTTSASVCSNQLPYVWNGSSYTSSGSYTATLINTNGCDSVVTLNLTVSATSSSSSPVAICSDDLPYVWNGISYQQGGIYSITITNNKGCDSIATLFLDVTASPIAFVVTGGGTYFSGGAGLPVGLASSQNGYSYQLLLNGNPVTGAALIGNGSAISFGNQTAAGNYTVLALAGTQCYKNMQGNVTVNVNSNPPEVYTVTGGGYYCSGSTGVAIGLSSSQAGVSYQLLRSNGSISVGSPITGNGASISFGNQTIADSYTVRATNATNGLFAMMSNSVSVRVISSSSGSGMPGSISGPSNVCLFIGQGLAQYRINGTINSTSYLWSVPAGASIVGSATDTIVSVQYNSTFATGAISVVSKNACLNSTSTPRTLTLTKSVPAAPAAIIGSTDVCSFIGSATSSTPVNYKISKVANATSYTWTVPAGATIQSAGDSSIDVVFASSFVSGNITVTSVSPCGNSTTAKTLTVYKRSTTTPAAIQKSFTPSVAAVTNVCGSDSQTYRIRKVAYATTYNWVMKNGTRASIIRLHASGSNDTAVIVNFANNYTIDTLQVQAINACSASPFRTIVLTRMLVAPAATNITASTGNFAPCIGSTVTYTATAAAPTSTQGAIATFNWTRPANTTILSATTDSSSIVLGFNNGYNGGSLSVRGRTACGVFGTARTVTMRYSTPTPTSISSGSGSYNACIGSSITYTVVVGAPSATQVAAAVYRWTRPANTAIIGAAADSSSITLQFNAGYVGGALTAKGQTACGVLGTAKSQTLTHTGCPTGSKAIMPVAVITDQKISVYPNPSSSTFLFNTNSTSVMNLRITDLQGRVLENYSKVGQVRLGAGLRPGVYMLHYNDGTSSGTVRLIKE